MVRGMIMRGMKKDIPKDKYETFAVITQDENAWKQAAGYERSEEAYVLLLDASGKIRWKTHGAPDAHYAELKTQIAQLAERK
jgi:predicted transcriptional regulator